MNTLLHNISGRHPAPDSLALAVGMGRIHGWRLIRFLSRNDDVDAGTEDVWVNGGVRTLPSSAGTATVVSTSASDAAAGTGVRTLLLEGLDTNYDEISETITMNGITGVTSTKSYLRINKMTALTGGSGATAAGNITCTVGGNVQANMFAGAGRTQLSQYTIPRNHVFIPTSITIIGSATGSANLIVEMQVMEQGTSVWVERDVANVVDGGFDESDLEGIMILPEKADIRFQATSDTANQALSVSYHGYLVSKDVM